jgi:hypothetical protein
MPFKITRDDGVSCSAPLNLDGLHCIASSLNLSGRGGGAVGGATGVLGLTSKMSGSSPRPCHLRLVGVVKNNSKEKSAKNIFICRRIFIKKEIFLMAGVLYMSFLLIKKQVALFTSK